MTKKEQIATLLVNIRTAKTGNRKAIWERIQEIKKVAKVSYEKLGVTNEILEQIPSLLEAAPKADRKVRAVREYALHIINDLPVGATRAAKIEALMDRMSITKYNAMYYVDRVAKAA